MLDIYEAMALYDLNNPPCPQCGREGLIPIFSIHNIDLMYRCTRCAMTGEPQFIFTQKEIEDGYMKKVEIAYTHNKTIVEIKFIIIPRRGWFQENVKPLTEFIKSKIPAVQREWNPITQKWSIAVEFWPPLEQTLKLLQWDILEVAAKEATDIPGVNVPKDYAEQFYYNDPVTTPTESASSIAEKLSDFLGVKITTQEVKDLKKLYRAKALELHPDRGGDANKMSELNRLWTLYTSGGIQ